MLDMEIRFKNGSVIKGINANSNSTRGVSSRNIWVGDYQMDLQYKSFLEVKTTENSIILCIINELGEAEFCLSFQHATELANLLIEECKSRMVD